MLLHITMMNLFAVLFSINILPIFFYLFSSVNSSSMAIWTVYILSYYRITARNIPHVCWFTCVCISVSIHLLVVFCLFVLHCDCVQLTAECQTLFCRDYTDLFSHRQCIKMPVAPYSYYHWHCQFLYFSIPVGL